MKRFLHIRTSDHENSYIYDRSEKRLLYVHPVLRDIIMFLSDKTASGKTLYESLSDKYDQEQVAYYYEKYKHWELLGIYENDSEYQSDYALKMDPLSVKKQLANIDQIVFEVTDRCNLRCYYCGYGQLYDFYDTRSGDDLSKERAFLLIDYMCELWQSSYYTSMKKEVCISFYGGEPLMNVPLIQEIIAYLSSKRLSDIDFYFSMTTNGVLLRKYADFLVQNDFRLLISLDGNSRNNSYRTFKNKKISFDLVYENICYIRQMYPDYFSERVNFNSVLHNRNSVSEIYGFIKNEFGKMPAIGELNTMGVREGAKKDFFNAYKNTTESLHQQEDYSGIEQDMFVLLPDIKSMVYFIHRYTGNVYSQYNDFFLDKKKISVFPTGTCFPFSRKLFLTTGGKILQCERIAHKFSLGMVDDHGVKMDYEKIAEKFETWYSKMSRQCKYCFRLGACSQCLFYVDDLDGNPKCPGFATIQVLEHQFGTSLFHLEENSKEYSRITKEITLI